MKKYLIKLFSTLAKQRRDPRYIFVIIGGTIVFAICFLQVRDSGLFDSFERPVLNYFNNLPHSLYGFMYATTQMGGLTSLIVWSGIAWYLVSKRAAYTVLGTGFAAWALAKVAKVLAHRGRPPELLTNIHLFSGENFHGFGFPSGHSTLSAACAAMLYYQVAPKYRKYLLLIVLLVGISRMYLGAHFPLDVVGGWALGAVIGSTVVMIFGVSTKGLSGPRLKKFLCAKGLDVTSLSFADLDARGSRPVFITTADGQDYFGKIFGRQEHAADWLFKLFRFFRYKNLQAEEPHINSRRNLEIEAFSMLWAKQAGVRVAKVINLYRYGTNWLLIQEKVDAIPMSEHGHILQQSLEDAWRQVNKLHRANMAHRDLRAANLMIDKAGKVWIIDFGFAEVVPSKQRLSMDVAELLMSMALIVGVQRTVAAAKVGIGEMPLKRALPYLQKAVFSGATTKLLKQHKTLLKELKSDLATELGIEEDVDEADVIRFNKRSAINIVLLAVFIYVIAPQFTDFKDAIRGTDIVSGLWLLPLALSSLATYVLTGIVYVALAEVPLKIRNASLVQLAASFVSKILPGGVGGTTLNAKFMTKAGMDDIETSAVISSQAVIGFIMFVVPLELFLLLNGTNIFKLIDLPLSPLYLLIGLAVAVTAGATVLAIRKLRVIITEKASAALESFRNINTPPRELAIASVASSAVTAAYIFCLYAALRGIGVNIGISGVVLAYATAVIAKSAIPTPGGLGPVEAAMIGTLLSLGIQKEEAFAAVLIYRLATFWIPIPFSLLAYRYISRKKLI